MVPDTESPVTMSDDGRSCRHPILDSGFFITSGVEGSCSTWSRDLGYHHPISVGVGVSGEGPLAQFRQLFPGWAILQKGMLGLVLKVSPSSFSSSAWPPSASSPWPVRGESSACHSAIKEDHKVSGLKDRSCYRTVQCIGSSKGVTE